MDRTRCSPRCATSPPGSTPTTSIGSCSHFAEDAVFDLPRGAQLHGVTRFMGPAAMREAFAGHFAGIPDIRYREEGHFVDGDRGASEWTLSGTMTDGRSGHRGPRLRPLDVPRREGREEGHLLEDPDVAGAGRSRVTGRRPERPCRPAGRGPPSPPRRRRRSGIAPRTPRPRCARHRPSPTVVGGSHHSPLTRPRSASYAGLGVPSARTSPAGAPSQAPSSVRPQ